MRFYYFLTPSLTYSPPQEKSHAFWKSSSGKLSAAAAQRVPQSPLPAVPTSAVPWAKHRLCFNASISQLLTLQLSAKELKKNPISLSPTTHLHSSCSSLWSPCSDRSLQQDWTHGLKLFCEKPGCSPTLWKTNFFFHFFPAWLLPLLFLPKHTILQNVHFCATTRDFLPSLWNIRNGHQKFDLGLFFRKSAHTYMSW